MQIRIIYMSKPRACFKTKNILCVFNRIEFMNTFQNVFVAPHILPPAAPGFMQTLAQMQ